MPNHVYCLPPVDTDSVMLPSVETTISEMEARFDPKLNSFIEVPTNAARSPSDILWDTWKIAKQEATKCGWDGSYLYPPKVFWLPHLVGIIHGFVITQKRDGKRFVLSPIELPWLEPCKTSQPESA